MTSRFMLPVLGASLALAGCASNYAGEGALAGAAGGALIGAATDGNVGRGAAIGAAAGGAVGAVIKKNGRCYQRDSNGYEYRVRC
ncbi:glycine zipper domain-containing protein [Novosphingobium sp. KCTC 2891]|uniref:glycine zipper domain-containing protein n=1 Tax=Novosphingobium sp. KCTC 2891 TaxID=2989730 RepID=UPI0022239030|nr:glycine zipper domain-containing protein [Novosphingobium sp. KCTC 2891]MCW1381658.1 glycine zipper domain-containing protein [Novosphingobium sp. KCTC 2891]